MPPAADAGREQALDVIRREVAACRRCEVLACARQNTVFGSGPAAARLCFFGEAPGADEDRAGLPFVGRAGQLLTKIIEACRLSRDEVYILNVLKCRPPDNRQPLPDEVSNCRDYFERQFRVIAPEFICCLGTTAAQSLLQTTEPIGRLRGRWFTHGSAHVICTYHPSYLLRNPGAKRHVWDDMKILMARMGVEL
jgi:DNA polymerase